MYNCRGPVLSIYAHVLQLAPERPCLMLSGANARVSYQAIQPNVGLVVYWPSCDHHVMFDEPQSGFRTRPLRLEFVAATV